MKMNVTMHAVVSLLNSSQSKKADRRTELSVDEHQTKWEIREERRSQNKNCASYLFCRNVAAPRIFAVMK